MADARNCCTGMQNPSVSRKDNVCIDCNRVLDSCRDKDCFEDVPVFLTSFGQEIIEQTSNIRVKEASVLWAKICCEPVQFNRGFYTVNVKLHTKLICEACLAPGRVQEFDGIAVCEKKVILYGGEGGVNIFRSEPHEGCFCSDNDASDSYDTNSPTAVCEVAEPIVLSLKVSDERPRPPHCCCCCSCNEIPMRVQNRLSGSLADPTDDCKKLLVTLGFFSVIRIERPAQYLISACRYSVPEKECMEITEESPCRSFEKMPFPVNEFFPKDCI